LAVYGDREDAVNQGDIFRDVSFVIPRGPDRPSVVLMGMVVSHDCDCDKFFSERDRGRLPEPDRFCVAIAPTYPLSELQGGRAGDARAGRIRRFFPLPAEDEHPEMVVDLWFEQPIPMTELLDRERIGSLSEEYVRRLHIQIWELRTRIAAEKVLRGDHAT
jgi:hypothetical protein